MKLYNNKLHQCNSYSSILEAFRRAFVHHSTVEKLEAREIMWRLYSPTFCSLIGSFCPQYLQKSPSEPVFFYSVTHHHPLPSPKLSTSVLAPPAVVTGPYIYRCLTKGDGYIRWLLYSFGPLPPLWGIYGHLHTSCPRLEDGAKGPTF